MGNENEMACAIEEVECANGVDVTVNAPEGMTFQDGSTSMTLRARSNHGPRLGEAVIVGGVAIKVCDKRYDDGGRIWLMDEDTRAWHKWTE